MSDRRQHWDRAWSDKAETELSWFQEKPEQSLRLIRAAADHSASIIDVGGGASRLVGELLTEGYGDLTVLDISKAALAKSRARLGTGGKQVAWIAADVTKWQPDRIRAVWHDRAVFHFLTSMEEQNAYLAALRKATAPGSTVIMATFALDGPERCSGLPVQRYSPATLARRVGDDFHLIDEAAERHRTPAGKEQAFSYAVLRRR